MIATDLKTPIRVGHCRAQLGLSPTMMSAIIRAMHPELEPGRRINWIAPAAVQKFLRDNPTFRQADVYVRKKKGNDRAEERANET